MEHRCHGSVEAPGPEAGGQPAYPVSRARAARNADMDVTEIAGAALFSVRPAGNSKEDQVLSRQGRQRAATKP